MTGKTILFIEFQKQNTKLIDQEEKKEIEEKEQIIEPKNQSTIEIEKRLELLLNKFDSYMIKLEMLINKFQNESDIKDAVAIMEEALKKRSKK